MFLLLTDSNDGIINMEKCQGKSTNLQLYLHRVVQLSYIGAT